MLYKSKAFRPQSQPSDHDIRTLSLRTPRRDADIKIKRKKITPRASTSVKLHNSAMAGTDGECQAGLGMREQTPSRDPCQVPAFIIVMACQTGLGKGRRGGELGRKKHQGDGAKQFILGTSCSCCTCRGTFILGYL